MESRDRILTERKKLEQIDSKLLNLFAKRMETVDRIAEIKRASNLAITDEKREQEIVEWAVESSSKDLKGEVITFIRTLIGLSKFRQRKLLFDNNEEQLLPPPDKPKADKLKVAFQGTAGAWGEQALIQLFPKAERSSFQNFEDVFDAVKNKSASYGIVPIENSRTGAIGEVYDLLRKYGCYIVGQTWVQARHCLMAIPGTKINDVREVFSHPEGFKQCNSFLRNRAWDLTAYRNTAVAAKDVAQRKEKRFAAIGSPRAAELYKLEIIAQDIMDDKTNRTRFIVISDAPEYNESCDTVSLTFRTPHRSGALCEVLFHFLAAGINLTRIESRPMMGESFCFFADLNGNILDENVASGIRNAAASSGYMEVLGCYSSNKDVW